MPHDLLDKLMRHTDYLTRLVGISRLMLVATTHDNLDLLTRESANKDRILKILNMYHDQIINNFTSLGPEKRIELRDILLAWSWDTSRCLAIIDKTDQEILALLEKQKEQVKLEIASINCKRNKFRGYNLSNLRR